MLHHLLRLFSQAQNTSAYLFTSCWMLIPFHPLHVLASRLVCPRLTLGELVFGLAFTFVLLHAYTCTSVLWCLPYHHTGRKETWAKVPFAIYLHFIVDDSNIGLPNQPKIFEYWIYQITKVADRETDRKLTLRTFHCYPHLPRSTKIHALDIIEHFFLHPDHPMPMEGHLKKSLPRHAWERWVHATKHEVPPTNKQNKQTKTPCRYFRDVIGREWVGGKGGWSIVSILAYTWQDRVCFECTGNFFFLTSLTLWSAPHSTGTQGRRRVRLAIFHPSEYVSTQSCCHTFFHCLPFWKPDR